MTTTTSTHINLPCGYDEIHPHHFDMNASVTEVVPDPEEDIDYEDIDYEEIGVVD